jgi:hypothetical protein
LETVQGAGSPPNKQQPDEEQGEIGKRAALMANKRSDLGILKTHHLDESIVIKSLSIQRLFRGLMSA